MRVLCVGARASIMGASAQHGQDDAKPPAPADRGTAPGPALPVAWWAALAVLAGVHLLWPGNVRWAGDQPLLIMSAWTASSLGELAPHGLTGTAGFHYGGLPTWIYQGLLLLSDDLAHVALLKNALTLGVYVACLAWLSRALSLTPWPLLLPLLSPLVYDYDRILWDNVFQWPLSLLLVTALVRFWARGGVGALAAVMACAVALVLTHLMSSGLLLAVLIVLSWLDRRVLLERWRAVLALVVLGAGSASLYLWPALKAYQPGASEGANLLRSAWGALTAVKVFSAAAVPLHFPELLETGPLRQLVPVAVVVSGLILPLWLAAMVGAVRHLLACRRAGTFGVVERLLVLACASVLVHVAVIVGMGVPYRDHYVAAVWLPYFFPLWWWLDRLLRERRKVLLAIAALQAGASLCGFALYVTHLHANRGNGGLSYGPTLAVQLEAAHEVAGHSPRSKLSLDRVPLYRVDPFALQSLVRLEIARRGVAEGEGKLLVVEPAGSARSGELRVLAVER